MMTQKQALSIRYQIAIAKLPLATDVDDFLRRDLLGMIRTAVHCSRYGEHLAMCSTTDCSPPDCATA